MSDHSPFYRKMLIEKYAEVRLGWATPGSPVPLESSPKPPDAERVLMKISR